MSRVPGPQQLHRFVSRVRRSARVRLRYASLALAPARERTWHGHPSAFSEWARRGIDSAIDRVPDEWSEPARLLSTPHPRVAVVVHVFYPELLEDIVQRLASIPVEFDLIITNATGQRLRMPEVLPGYVRATVILPVENRGRDMWPLVQLVNAHLLDPYALILKVHTKRSAWRDSRDDLPGSGESWRTDLLQALLGNANEVRDILGSFATAPELGLVTADRSLLGPKYWGADAEPAADLLRRLELGLDRERLSFAAGSMYWVRGFLLQGLRALCLTAADFEPEAGQVDGTTAHALERVIGILTEEAGYVAVERSRLKPAPDGTATWRRFESQSREVAAVRVVPFYLPQFHPIPENDRWWGSGFTEWTNVVRARPVFPGHYQPRLPTTTGFYDLRSLETVRLQMRLAQQAGIAGFMYYHYWFGGQELLGRPIHARLQDDTSLPFCLMWANENWTRRWDGRQDAVLMAQEYGGRPAQDFIDDVVPILRDSRYLRIDGRPVLAIYRPRQIPGLRDVLAYWRTAILRADIGDPLLLQASVGRQFDGFNDDEASEHGLDGSIGFPPHRARWTSINQQRIGAAPSFEGNILDYATVTADAILELGRGISRRFYPGVMTAFDNTARRPRNPDLWYGANPYTFRRWLAAAAAAVSHRPPDHRLVFVNAWNEWAEGAVLEPSDRHGATYLMAVRSVTYP